MGLSQINSCLWMRLDCGVMSVNHALTTFAIGEKIVLFSNDPIFYLMSISPSFIVAARVFHIFPFHCSHFVKIISRVGTMPW